ncbi:copper chaperone PCu(A)C [Micavibrio aeruginosavorus]|uniref:copper chaperone PCu(A)C n=1 Tax=Micavibrio aeruginosavorus TaxID=349221 RepID=UPI003F4AF68B
MKMRSAALTALMLSVLSSAAYADVIVHDAYSFATVSGTKTGAVFLTVGADAADRLIGAETPVTKRAELHTHANDNGIMKMRKTDGFDVSADEGVALKPGGNHIMLMDLSEPLVKDQTFPLTLVFEKAGKVETTVLVRAAGDVPADHDHGHDHGDDHTGHAH